MHRHENQRGGRAAAALPTKLLGSMYPKKLLGTGEHVIHPAPANFSVTSVKSNLVTRV